MSSTGNGTAPDPDDDQDRDDNGDPQAGAGVVSAAVTLMDQDEPTSEDGDAQTNLTVDFGFYPLGSLGDRVWLDANRNGVQDDSEAGIEQSEVILYDARTGDIVARTRTAEDGSYLFTDLEAGTYYVEFPLLFGHTFTATGQGNATTDSDADPDTGHTPEIILGIGAEDLSWDAGIYPVASLGNRAWYDINGDGIQDSGEPGIPGVTVHLYRADGTLRDTTATDEAGLYLFSDLEPGEYYVEFIMPEGYLISPRDQGNDDTDSDIDPETGRTALITLEPGDNMLILHAGMVPALSLGNFVWLDENNNGAVDADEPGIDGVVVELYRDTNYSGLYESTIDTLVAQTETANSGQYLFADLLPGEYVVVIPEENFVVDAALEHYTSSTGNGTAPDPDDDADNDDNGDMTAATTAASAAVTLRPDVEPLNDGDDSAHTNLTVDFGFFYKLEPTAITLVSFRAIRQEQGIAIHWETGSELDSWGFHLWRSSDGTRSSAVQATSELILAQGNSTRGARYTWMDTGIEPDNTYTYWLEEIELDGTRNEYGPISTIVESDVQSSHQIYLPAIVR
jgi:hypothetical protein